MFSGLQALFVDPVIVADGLTYERSAIEEWLRRNGATSPTTLLPLRHTDLVPNVAVRSFAHMIRDRA